MNRCTECNRTLWCSLVKNCGNCMDKIQINLGRKERARRIQKFKIEYAQRMKEEAEAERKKKIQEDKERQKEEKKQAEILDEKNKKEEKELKLKEEEKKRKEQQEKREREEEARKVMRAKKKMKMSTSEAIEKLLGTSMQHTMTTNGHVQYVSNGYNQNMTVSPTHHGNSNQNSIQAMRNVSSSTQHSAQIQQQQKQQQQVQSKDGATKSQSTSSTTKQPPQKKETKESSEVRNKEMEDILNLDTVDNTPTGMNGSVWYIMSENWLRSWRHYVFGVQSAPRPGPVDNWNLLKTHDENDYSKQRAKEGLKQVEDYRGVNRMVWEYFVNIYGGGPAIVRKDLDIHLPPLDPKPMMNTVGHMVVPMKTQQPVLNTNSNAGTTPAAVSSAAESNVAVKVST